MSDLEFNLKNYQLEGELLDILTYPAPILKKVAGPVEIFDSELKTLIKNMLYTMYKAPGLGLASPQVGLSKRLFVLDIEFNREKITDSNGELQTKFTDFNPLVFINPKITNSRGEMIHEEGCLSVPGIFEDVKRASDITVDFQDMDGKHHSIEVSEMLAVCIQHENDHLNGVIFLERLSLLKRNLLKKKYLKRKKRN